MLKKIATAFMVVCASFVLTISSSLAASKQPPKDYINKSWTHMTKVSPLKVLCTTTIGTVVPAQGLSEDDQKIMALLQIAFTKAKVELEVKQMKKEQQISVKKSVLAVGEAIGKFIAKEITYDDALVQIEQVQRVVIEAIISPKGIFYAADSIGKKTFRDAVTHKDLYKILSSGNVTDTLDKKVMKFNGKVGDTFVYTGLYSQGATDSMVKAMAPSYVGVGPATVQLMINEKSRQWSRSEAEVMINGEKGSFPIREVCAFRYAKDAAIILPKGFKKVDTNTGKSEFGAMLMAF